MFALNLLSVTEKVLVQLNLTLVGKSDLYSDIYLRAVFRLNNNHYVLKALQRAGLLDLVQLSEPDCEDSYHDMIREHKRSYSQRWVEWFLPSSCLAFLRITIYDLRRNNQHFYTTSRYKNGKVYSNFEELNKSTKKNLGQDGQTPEWGLNLEPL